VAQLPAVDMSVYPDLEMDTSKYKKINLDTLNKAQMNQWQVGDTLLLTGLVFFNTLDGRFTALCLANHT
jgi:fumarate hydratase class I